jgi:hypothetical protein
MTKKQFKVHTTHDFPLHVQGCDKCSKVDLEDTKTLGNCCVQGSKLLIDYLTHDLKKERK